MPAFPRAFGYAASPVLCGRMPYRPDGLVPGAARGGAVRFPSSLDRAAAYGAVLWPLLDASRDTLLGGFLTACHWWRVCGALPVPFFLLLYLQPKNLASFAGVAGVGPRAPRGGSPACGGAGGFGPVPANIYPNGRPKAVGRGNALTRRCNALTRLLCWFTLCGAVAPSCWRLWPCRCFDATSSRNFPRAASSGWIATEKARRSATWCKPKARRPKAEVAAVLPSRSVHGLLGAGGRRARPACGSWPRRCCRSGLPVGLGRSGWPWRWLRSSIRCRCLFAAPVLLRGPVLAPTISPGRSVAKP